MGAVAFRIEPGPLSARGRRRRRASPKTGTEAPVAIVTDIIVGGESMVLSVRVGGGGRKWEERGGEALG